MNLCNEASLFLGCTPHPLRLRPRNRIPQMRHAACRLSARVNRRRPAHQGGNGADAGTAVAPFPTPTGGPPRGLFRRATRAFAERCGMRAETGGAPCTFAGRLPARSRPPGRSAPASGPASLRASPRLRSSRRLSHLRHDLKMGSALFGRAAGLVPSPGFSDFALDEFDKRF